MSDKHREVCRIIEKAVKGESNKNSYIVGDSMWLVAIHERLCELLELQQELLLQDKTK